jgi:hypothetical protein
MQLGRRLRDAYDSHTAGNIYHGPPELSALAFKGALQSGANAQAEAHGFVLAGDFNQNCQWMRAPLILRWHPDVAALVGTELN